MHSSKKAQIAYLKADQVSIEVLCKYVDFTDMFCLKLAAKLFEHTSINGYIIELIVDWQLLYNPINSLGLVKLEKLKTYIKNNLANEFIRPSKSLAEAYIYFNK